MSQADKDNPGDAAQTDGTNERTLPRGRTRVLAVVVLAVASLLLMVCLALVTARDMPVPAGALWLYWVLIAVWYFASIQLWMLRDWALGFALIMIIVTLVIGLVGSRAVLPQTLGPLSLLSGVFWFATWLGVRRSQRLKQTGGRSFTPR